jgi:hypothetical protein
MKKLIVIACSAALLHGYSLALAQNHEIASAKYASKKEIEKSHDTSKPKDEAVKEHIITEGARTESSSFDAARASYERKVEKTSDFNKVGPNGEEIFLKGHKYYYLNNEGRKVKIKSSQMKDKAKHS